MHNPFLASTHLWALALSGLLIATCHWPVVLLD